MSTVKSKERKLGRATSSARAGLSRAEIAERGLCSTCIHKDDCVFLSGATEPVKYCDEFDSGITTVPPKKEISAEESTETGEDTELKGLCVNCENRETCTFEKPKSGVWHCEEYR